MKRLLALVTAIITVAVNTATAAEEPLSPAAATAVAAKGYLWGYATVVETRTVDVHVAQVRAKLGDASPIRTVRGVGYSADERG